MIEADRQASFWRSHPYFSSSVCAYTSLRRQYFYSPELSSSLIYGNFQKSISATLSLVLSPENTFFCFLPLSQFLTPSFIYMKTSKSPFSLLLSPFINSRFPPFPPQKSGPGGMCQNLKGALHLPYKGVTKSLSQRLLLLLEGDVAEAGLSKTLCKG